MNEQQRKQYHSIPLRSQARPARERTTDAAVATQPRPSAPAAPIQSLVSRRDMPAMVDDDRQRAPKSAVWLTDAHGNPVIRKGHQQMVLHQEKPPRRVHWLLFVGVGMIVTIGLWIGAQWAITSIQANNINAQYGMPRTYQCDAVVGHGDSAAHPSHFIFENLNGHIIIIEIPGGNLAHSRMYSGPTIYTPHGDQVPVTGSFADVNGDGRPDMLVSIGTGTGTTQTITFLNNGSIFVPQS